MHLTPQAFVSIVTPVFNGDKYMQECIESVLAQTYTNWEYLIVNNFSTDRTLAIAEYYSQKDTRITVHNNEKFLSIVDNHNNAIRQISPESKYCKMLQADDLLLPDCVMQMVQLAQANPSVGAVGSYWIRGERVSKGLPYPTNVISGRELCRSSLLSFEEIFSVPTTTLIRTDLIRTRDPFYNESILGMDKEAIYGILQDSDFGFVHQVLTYIRLHDERASHQEYVITVMSLSRIHIIKKYGPIYLNTKEFQTVLRKAWKNYYGILAKNLTLLRKKQVRAKMRKTFEDLGISFSVLKLLIACLSRVSDHLLNPKNSAEKLIRRISKKIKNFDQE